MLLVHGFAGAISTKYILEKSKKYFNLFQLNVIWFLGIIGGIFPDFDIALAYLNKDIQHRKLLTHSFIPYLTFFLLVFLVVSILKLKKENKVFIKTANLVFLIGVSSHLFLDYFTGGLQLLSPITNYYFGYHLPFNANSPLWQYMYFTSFYILAEVLIGLWFVKIFKNIDNVVGKYLPLITFSVAILATLMFMYF